MKARLSGFFCYLLVTLLFPAAKASAQTNTNCALVMTCPSNIVVTSCFNVQEFYNPTASNICCGVNSTVTCTPPSGSIFAVGTITTVTCTATDCAQNTNFCTFTVTVLRGNCATNCLQIQCPSNIVVTSCTNIPEFYTPTVTDSCCSNWNVVCSPASGSYFAPGTTNLVDCFVTDFCGLSNSCSFTVTVLRETNCPTNCLQVQCPGNKTAQCGTQWSFDAPTATSCCTNEYGGSTGPGTNVLITPIGTVTNGACPGTITVTQTWSITDLCGGSNTCSQTVTLEGCCTNPCSGPGMGLQSIQWLQLPTNTTRLLPNPTGANGGGTWIITNLPGYGNVLVVQQAPTNVVVRCTNSDFGRIHASGSFDNPPTSYGYFDFTETGYGPYTWGVLPGSVELAYGFPYTLSNNLPPYTVSFYFLDGQPNPGSLVFATIGLSMFTTNTLSQPFTFRTEYDLLYDPVNYPQGPSADTVLDGTYGSPLIPGVSGTVISSAYVLNGGDDYNTGYAILQPTNYLLTANLPSGSGFDVNLNPYPSSITNPCPYITITVNHYIYDIFSTTVGYLCCTNCPTNCLQLTGTTNKTVQCGSNWMFDPPTATSCCTNEFVTGPATETNVLITAINTVTNGTCPNPMQITRTWSIIDGCGDSNTWSQTVTVLGCCTNCLIVNCPTNKTVACGTEWSFDLPTATTCCTNLIDGELVVTNVLISVVSTQTNGVCPQVTVIQTWSIVDACGDSNSCSQMVTVTGCCTNSTNCLQIQCPSNIVVTACAAIQLFYSPVVTDLCCSNGTVLAAGGVNTSATNYDFVSTELYNPAAGLWTLTGSINTARSDHKATLLVSGQVLVEGGVRNGYDTGLASAELYNPVTGMWTYTGSMNGARDNHTATLLPNGQVLVAGGGPDPSGTAFLASAELYDPATGIWTITGALNAGRLSHTATLLPDGTVLAAGGACCNGTFLASAEWYNPTTGSWTTTGSMTTGRSSHTATLLANGKVLVAGGVGDVNGQVLGSAELYDPATGAWTSTGPMNTGRVLHVATLLPNGKVLIEGGMDVNQTLLASAELYDPATGVWTTTDAMNTPLIYDTATLLPNGTVLAASGIDNGSTGQVVGSAELYDPATGMWTPTGSLNNARSHHTATLLSNGAGPNWTVVCTPPSGSYFEPGTTTNVQCVVTDSCGMSNFCSFTVTVLPGTNCPTNCLQINCATNKSVQCGSSWSFNPPTATSCCTNNFSGTSTNVAITTLSTMTNGACPQTITVTRTWSIVDACGASNTCSQVVTLAGCCTNCLTVNCATNKSVQCGSNWTFDMPTATSCCTTNISGTNTNVLITIKSTVTNGVCPQIITRIWAITDVCGDSNTCSQVVTVVDTTPPVITCPTNIVVVALNSNCQFVIPTVQVSATDNCTPVCSLVYSQSPTNGTIVSGTNATVTVTVTDLCGNSNSCHVRVEGKPETGPVVTIPTSIIISNCIVPCLSNYLTATDNCCPQSSLKITQSVPCGDLIASGGEIITVTVTDCHGNATSKTVHLVPGGTNSFLAYLTNTGSKVSSYVSVTTAPNPINLLADGFQAVPYTLPPSALNLCASMPHDYLGYPVAASDAVGYVPWSLAPDPAIPASGAVSKWIAPNIISNNFCPCGLYTYTLPFTLPADFVASTATISGRWSADNGAVAMLINSTVTANVMLPVDSHGYYDGFAHWTYFTINSGFLSGANTLQFVVTNQIFSSHLVTATGLRVEFTSAYASCAPCAAPSIISITPAQSLQEYSTASFSVHAGGTPPLSYQWQFNGANIAGANNSTLHLPLVGYSSAGLYTVIISNPCGVVTGKVALTVTQPLPWPNGSWNVGTLTNALSATFGSNLVLTGPDYTTNFALNVGTTTDFGLPEEGGQEVNVMDINPAVGATIELPLIAEPGSDADTNYTLIMDIYEPDTSLGTSSTLFQNIACCISNLGSGGQDGLAVTLDASNYLHLTGAAGGTPFDSASIAPMTVDAWHRLALAVDGGVGGVGGSATLYLDGQTAIPYTPCLCCSFLVPVLWTNIVVVTNSTQVTPIIFSAPTDTLSTNGEFYVSGIQFHAIAMAPQMIAGIGSPASGPAPVNQTSISAAPVLSATLSNGVINITWSGDAYVLQETSDPGSGVWAKSTVPFTETGGASTATTATVTPASNGPSKFYRLVFSP